MPKRKPGTVVTFKNGAKAKVLPNGRMRIISGPKKKKGGGVMVGGSIRIGGGKRRKSIKPYQDLRDMSVI